MWHSATISAYDLMNVIHVHASVRVVSDDPSQAMETALTVTTTLPGVGETDPSEWLRDALVALLEVT